MRRQLFEHKPNRFSRLVSHGVPVVVILLLISYCFSIYSTNLKYGQIQFGVEQSVEFFREISTVQFLIMQMELDTQRWFTCKTDHAVTQQEIEENFGELDDSIAKISAGSVGQEDAIASLTSSLNQIKKLLTSFAGLCENNTNGMMNVPNQEKEQVADLFLKALQETRTIQINSSYQISEHSDKIKRLSEHTLIWAVVLTSLVFVTTGALMVLIRISQKKLYAQSRWLSMISETVDEMFIIEDMDRKSSDFVSKGAERILGISCSELMEESTAYTWHLSMEDRAKLAWERSTVSAGAPLEVRVDYTYPVTGAKRQLSVGMYVVEAKRGRKKRITMVSDITRDAEVRRNLTEALAAAQKANEAKRDFLSHMSHEIRTPMNAIIGMTAIASASVHNPARVDDCLKKICISSKHLLMLLNNILDMSKIESNKLVLNCEPFDLIFFLNTFSSLSREQCLEKGIAFDEKRSGFEEDSWYVGDMTRVNQILLNLMSNATKFTDAGGQVAFEASRVAEHSGVEKVRFSVRDTGIGMSEAELSRMFQPFEQADSAISRKYGGTGLGMSITKNLVSLMGGFIQVTSQPGEGTCCVVELPFEKAEQRDRPRKDPKKGWFQLLVVGQSGDTLSQMTGGEEKIKVDWAQSVHEAVRLVRSAVASGKQYDACLIDCTVPKRDVAELAGQFGQDSPYRIPLILLSNNCGREAEVPKGETCVSAQLLKPIAMDTLCNLLIAVTGKTGFSAQRRTGPEFLKGKRLLVAEDNPLNLEITQELLRMNGLFAEGAKDGAEAVERFLRSEAGYYDALLMDIQMPGMDGYAATRAIRASIHPDGKTVPIIAITANAFSDDVSAALAAGMNAHVSKPLNVPDLLAVLEELTQKPE
ncbi:MAG: barA 2 [Oscillospiraceae bacterium]|nr:barA 2 [Oscillospiraceae bacterium]